MASGVVLAGAALFGAWLSPSPLAASLDSGIELIRVATQPQCVVPPFCPEPQELVCNCPELECPKAIEDEIVDDSTALSGFWRGLAGSMVGSLTWSLVAACGRRLRGGGGAEPARGDRGDGVGERRVPLALALQPTRGLQPMLPTRGRDRSVVLARPPGRSPRQALPVLDR